MIPIWKWKSLSHIWLFVTPWTIQSINSPGQSTGVGSLSLLQGIFPTQGPNPGLSHCRRILYQLSHKESPIWKALYTPWTDICVPSAFHTFSPYKLGRGASWAHCVLVDPRADSWPWGAVLQGQQESFQAKDSSDWNLKWVNTMQQLLPRNERLTRTGLLWEVRCRESAAPTQRLWGGGQAWGLSWSSPHHPPAGPQTCWFPLQNGCKPHCSFLSLEKQGTIKKKNLLITKIHIYCRKLGK